jgi:hypothetical protein
MLPTVSPMTSAAVHAARFGHVADERGIPPLAGVPSLGGFEQLAQVFDRRGPVADGPAVELRRDR